MSELTKRLLKKFVIEDGAAAASGSAGAANGASVTGNAGLSSLGQVPTGVSGMVGSASKKKKGRECRSCGYTQVHEGKICFECGDRLPKETNKSVDERLADFRTEQIMLSKGPREYGWIEDCVDTIMNVVKTGHPEVLHENDEIGNKELVERVKNMLHGYNNWRINRQEGRLF